MTDTLEERVRELEVFAASVFHNLSNPMFQVQKLVELLSRAYEDQDDELIQLCIKELQKNTDFMSRVWLDLRELRSSISEQ